MLMEEIKQSDDIILFIDEVHTLIGAGAAEGAIDAANILKPALARGELQASLSQDIHANRIFHPSTVLSSGYTLNIDLTYCRHRHNLFRK